MPGSREELVPCHEDRFKTRGLLRELGSDLLFCGGVALVLTFIFAAYQDPSIGVWLQAFLLNFIISTAIGMSLSNLYRFAHKPILKRFPGRFAYYASHVLIVIVGVTVGVEVAIRIIEAIGGPSPSLVRADVLSVGIVVATVIVVTVIAFEKLRARAREVELRAQQAQKEALRAQLEALQARTNPHFLFNSLNTVAGLIEEEPKSAERVLERLSGLFRYSLDGSKTTWVRIEEEIAALRDYLAVEEIRLGDRLRAVVEVEPEVELVLVPPLVLQPLVENAILHAVAPRRAGGSVAVRASRTGSAIVLSVTDDGPGLGNSEHQGTGSSLSELRQRLEMVYGGAARLETSIPEGGGCEVRLELPLEPAVEEHEPMRRTGPR